jgi:hypothetical protein
MFNPRPKLDPLGPTLAPIADGKRVATWRRLFRPSALGTLGLTLAVVLWGYNYKLSLYRSHRDSASRILVAKLWVDQRHAAAPANAERHPLPNAIEPAPLPPFRRIHVGALLIRPARVGCTAGHRSLLPLRSPPFSSL